MRKNSAENILKYFRVTIKLKIEVTISNREKCDSGYFLARYVFI